MEVGNQSLVLDHSLPRIGPFGHEFRHSFVAMDGVKQNCVMDDGYIKKCMMDGYIQNRIMGFPRLVIVYSP